MNYTSENYPLTKEETISFLTDHLKMPNIFADEVKFDKLNILNHIVRRIKHLVPGGNISFLTSTGENYMQEENLFLRKTKNDMLSLQGGQCLWFSGFLSAILSNIGYKVGLVGANDRSLDSMYDSHSAILVFDLLYPGSKHLVESSPTYPIFAAVPLNGDKEYDLCSFGGTKHKFVDAGNGIVKYCHLLQRGALPRTKWSDVIEQENELWEVDMEYRTAACKPLSYFTGLMVLVVSIPSIVPFYHTNIFLRGFSKGKGVVIFNQKVTLTDENGYILEKFSVNSSYDIVEVVTKYFPQYTPTTIKKCLVNRGKVQAFTLSP